MTDPNWRNEEPYVGVSHEPVVRVVVAGADAPDSLRYLLDAEGFLVIGCATDETQLERVLRRGLDPDVVVLDSDISVPSVVLSRERAPSAHIIVLWPDGVQRLPGTEQITPSHVYEQLGPAIRRAVHERPQLLVIPDPVTEEPASVSEAPVTRVADAPPARAASRVSIASLALSVVLVLMMGAAFASDGLRIQLPWAASRTDAPAVPQTPDPNVLRASPGADRPLDDPSAREEGTCQRPSNGIPSTNASPRAATALARMCPTGGDSGGKPQHPGKSDVAGNDDRPGPGDHPGKEDDPGKDDDPGGKPDGVGSGGSSHGTGGSPEDDPDSTHPGPATPHGDTGHGPR